MNNSVLISVIIPTYNRAHYIERAVQSVINQSYKNIEIIIVDDGSSDNTEDVIEKIRSQIKSIKIFYKKNKKNRGAQYVRDEGVRLSKGEWITFLDSDDEWLPTKVEKSYKYALRNNFKVVHCDCFVSNNNGEKHRLNIPKYEGNIYSGLLNKAGPLFPALFIKKDCFNGVNFFDKNILAHQEWDLSLQLAKKYEFGFIDEPLFIWYYDGHDSISTNKKRGAEGYLQIVEKYRDDILNIHGQKLLRHHYMEIALAFYLAKNYEQASLMYKLSMQLTNNNINRILNFFQSQLSVIKLINPKYLNIEKFYNKIRK